SASQRTSHRGQATHTTIRKSQCRRGANRRHSKAIATKEESKDEDDNFDTRGNRDNVVCQVPGFRRATPSRAARCGRASNTVASATSGQCRERHYHADGCEQRKSPGQDDL